MPGPEMQDQECGSGNAGQGAQVQKYMYADPEMRVQEYESRNMGSEIRAGNNGLENRKTENGNAGTEIKIQKYRTENRRNFL